MSHRSRDFNVYVDWLSNFQNSTYYKMLKQNNPINGTLYELYYHS